MDKSQILILVTDAVPEFVIDSGFKPVNNIKILGFNISNSFEDLVQNFPPVLDKINPFLHGKEIRLFRIWKGLVRPIACTC
jgi:hypothetical protein